MKLRSLRSTTPLQTMVRTHLDLLGLWIRDWKTNQWLSLTCFRTIQPISLIYLGLWRRLDGMISIISTMQTWNNRPPPKFCCLADLGSFMGNETAGHTK